MFLLETLFSQETITRLGWMLVHFLWQAAAVALLLAVALRLLRRTAAKLRYAIACGALALMVVLPVITMQLVAVPGLAAEAGPLTEIPHSTTVETIPMPVQQVGELPSLALTPQTELPPVVIPWRERLVAALEPALPYLVLGWLVGVFGLSAWHLGGWTQLHRLKRRMAREAGAALRATLDELATKLGVRRAVTLLESAIVEVPTVLGWLRPVILLPASALTGLNPDQLRAILAHELAHIRRHDYLANILQTVVEILGFYHPAVWWVSSRIRIERENCCDDLAVQVCGNSLQYAQALTSMEEIRHSRSDLALAASGGSLMARIARLLGRPAVDDRRFAWLPGLVALLLVVGVVIPTALALARSAPSALESPTDETAATPDPVELPDAQIAFGFVLADVAGDGVLAPQTAAEAAALLQRIANPAVPPTVEELRRPLGEVLSAFTPAPGRANDFIDLLGRTGYPARKLSSPRVTVVSGKSISFSMGTPPDSDASSSKDPDFVSMQFEAVAMALQDRKEIRVDVNLARAYPVDDRATPRIETATWTLKTTALTPDGQWTLIPDNRLKFTQDGREYIQLPVILASVVNEPAVDAAAVLPTTPMGQTVDLGPGMGGMLATASPQAMQILIKFSLFPAVSPDKVVDLETRNLVAGVLANEDLQALKEVIHADPRQKVTLGELLGTWVANRPMTPETLGVLIDVLKSRGYLGGEGTPEVLTRDGQKARMILGAETPRSAALGTEVQVTPRVPSPASGFVRLEIEAQWRERVDPNDTSDRPDIRATDMTTTIAIPFGKSVALVADKSDGHDGSLHMLLISPTVFDTPQSSEGQAPNANATAIVGGSLQDSTPDSNETQVRMDWMIAQARTETVLDRETLRLIGDVLAGERPQIARELAATRRKMTLGQVLKTYVIRQSLSPETGQALITLLGMRGLATVQSRPAVIVSDGEDFEIRTVSMEQFSIPAAKNAGAGDEPNVTTVEYGTTIKGTSHVEANGSVILEMAVTQTEPGPRTQSDALPDVRKTEIATKATVPENRYFSFLVESTDETRQAQDTESPLILVKPSIVGPAPQPEFTETRLLRLNHKTARRAKELLPREYQQYVQVQDRGDSEPNDAGYILTITAPAAIAGAIQDAARKLDVPPRQVLLDVRIVEIERADLLKSGVEWQFPTMSAGGSNDSTSREKIHVGYSRDATFTSSLLATLNRLEATHQAEILSNPQIVALDGHAAQLRSTQQEWFLMSDSSAVPPELQRTESGTILNLTPRIGDNNDITLEMCVEVSETLLGNADRPPITARRQVKNAVTIMTGGTVAVAGLTSKQSDQTTKELAVFITATLLPESNPVASSLPAPRKTGSPIASANHAASTEVTAKPTPRPEITETRHLYLNFRTREQVKDQLPAEYQRYVHVESYSSHVLAVTAPVAVMDAIMTMIRRLDSPPPQVLLDFQVFEIERAALKELGVDWSLPKEQAGGSGSGWPKSIQVGLSAGLTHTRSLMAALSQLEDASRAELRTNPQTICRNGKRARLIAIREEWFVMSEPDPNVIVCGPGWEKCACRAALRIIPRIDDTNDIALEMAMSINDSLSIARTVELTLNELPQSTNPITVQSGGTVVVAGFPVTSVEESEITRVIAIFVTASRVSGISKVGSVSIGDRSVDPVVRALALEIAKTEQDLAVLRQTRAETHPEIVRQKAILKGLEDRLQSRLVESSDRDLQREANAGTERLATSSGEIKRSDPQTAAFRDARVNWDGVVREWATQIAAMEKEIIVLRQAYLPSHPALQQKQDALQDLYRGLEGRRKTLRDEQSQRDAELRASLNRQ